MSAGRRACTVGVCALLAILPTAATAAAEAPPPVERRSLAGLGQPARIVIDRWGVSHIYAASAADAFFVQGYNAARDRLWQIDLWRKRGLGQLARNFGPRYVAQDEAARRLLYRGDMAAEWAAYPAEARPMAAAFVAGINAYVRQTRSGEAPLPPEFGLTDTRPDLWATEDVVRIRSHALASNLMAEVARAGAFCAGGADAARLLWPLEPAHEVTPPPGSDPCSAPLAVLDAYMKGTGAVTFDSPRQIGSQAVQTPPTDGSNAWVIGPGRTATGRPILANDPHRALAAPSLRYLVHLEAPGLSVIGAGEPAMPGVSLGHNADIAWGLTIFGIDQEDLYVYELDPANPRAYRYGSTWEPMTVARETVEVRGEPPRQVDLLFTRHGPVLAVDETRRRAFALRSVWSQPGTSAYFASAWLLRAKSWSDFTAARDRWGTPPLNLVYAHRNGDIGWSAAGLVPHRPNWDGLMPVPGDGRYEWRGFRSADELPARLNPAKGWIASANEMNLPKGYPRATAFEWADRSRITRLDAVLAATRRATIDDALALQTDTLNPMALRLTALLPETSDDPRLRQALGILRAWNGREDPGSAAAAIYNVWVSRFLPQAARARLAPPQALPYLGAGSLDAVISALEAPDPRLGADPRLGRTEVLTQSLQQTIASLTARLGPDMGGWTWGALHQVKFEPAVAALADREFRERLVVGPAPAGGSGQSPVALAYRPNDFRVTSGASVRLAMDVGDWDRSRAINTPGQSGDPRSPHYADLFSTWASGGAFPLLYSPEAVAKHTERIILLQPEATRSRELDRTPR